MPRPIVVATAAPVTPSRGNGPQPKMRQGPSTMLMPLASQSVRIVIEASPAPRKAALMTNSSSTVTLPPSMMRGYAAPMASAPGGAPMATMRRVPASAPTRPTTAAGRRRG